MPQHANKALADYRKARAVELAVQGMSYDRIAAEVGYANRGTAYRTVRKALQARIADNVDTYREIETARLDDLQAAVWDKAREGDTRAINTALKIIRQRSRLLGLEALPEHKPTTVVIG